MIDRLILWSLHNRFLVVSGFIALCTWGLFALQRVPIDAIPDLSENQVIVYADWPGRSPQEVEDQITYPLSVALQGLAGVKTVLKGSKAWRTLSRSGPSTSLPRIADSAPRAAGA